MCRYRFALVSIGESKYAETASTRRGKIAVLMLWFIAAVIYIALGVWIPWVFLLGFWQSAIYVAAVTALSPMVVRRFG